MFPPIFLRPGQQIKKFDIYRKSSNKDEKGRITYSVSREFFGTLKGSLSQISQKEREQWSQMGHPVTHKIVVRGRTEARAEDVLKRGNRSFYVQECRDQAELGIFSVLFCEERFGVSK